MKTWLILAAIISTSGSAARAQDVSEADIYLQVGKSPDVTAMWLDAIPKMASQCGYKLNGEAYYKKFSSMMSASVPHHLSRIQSGQEGNSLFDGWKGSYETESSTACTLVESLWGHKGTVFKGIVDERP